jgi:hypothetical protein
MQFTNLIAIVALTLAATVVAGDCPPCLPSWHCSCPDKNGVSGRYRYAKRIAGYGAVKVTGDDAFKVVEVVSRE